MTGIIVKALSGFYYVKTDETVFECKARGSFRKSGVSPLVADRVEFEQISENSGIIDKILPRKNAVYRPPVANIDKLFIVSSYTNPSPNTLLIDKMTVVARYNNIEPIIVFNKCDMGDFTPFVNIYKNAGFKVYTLSASEGIGIEALKAELKDSVNAFTGNSGVGKSSILNNLPINAVIETGEVSNKLGRGRHTTRHTELYELGFGGFVADTPGFSSFELDTADYNLKENLKNCFFDFEDYLQDCKFTSCTHTKEKGCAVLEALGNGKIEKSRHESYLALFDELKDLKPWQNKK
ncbi:MAG: ribosome small subunit-dependent GTPase A [Clostridia bacterium]|nr:ribosome small subunit-dependent GTPase A [Clostridia bacterium]